jgi:hypothetical protein
MSIAVSLFLLTFGPACSTAGQKVIEVPDDAKIGIVIRGGNQEGESNLIVYDLTKDKPVRAARCVPCSKSISDYLKKQDGYKGDAERCEGVRKDPETSLPICHGLTDTTVKGFGASFEQLRTTGSECDILIEKWGRVVYAVPEGCAN